MRTLCARSARPTELSPRNVDITTVALRPPCTSSITSFIGISNSSLGPSSSTGTSSGSTMTLSSSSGTPSSFSWPKVVFPGPDKHLLTPSSPLGTPNSLPQPPPARAHPGIPSAGPLKSLECIPTVESHCRKAVCTRVCMFGYGTLGQWSSTLQLMFSLDYPETIRLSSLLDKKDVRISNIC
jgi:hypothetical protein